MLYLQLIGTVVRVPVDQAGRNPVFGITTQAHSNHQLVVSAVENIGEFFIDIVLILKFFFHFRNKADNVDTVDEGGQYFGESSSGQHVPILAQGADHSFLAVDFRVAAGQVVAQDLIVHLSEYLGHNSGSILA